MSRFDPSINRDSDVASTGESNAAIEDLMGKVTRLGALYHWCASANRYQLDSISEPVETEDEQHEHDS